MIPNREERAIRAEYEYQRRRFSQREEGKKRALIVLAFAVIVNFGCIILNRYFHIFSFSLVCCKSICIARSYCS